MKIYKSVIDSEGKETWIKKSLKELIAELHPCPHCGHHELRIDNASNGSKAVIWCINCKHSIADDNLSKVMDAWNHDYSEVEQKFEEAKEEKREMDAKIKELNKAANIQTKLQFNKKQVRIKIDNECFGSLKEAAEFLEMNQNILGLMTKDGLEHNIKGFKVCRIDPCIKKGRFKIINETTGEISNSIKEAGKKYRIKASLINRYITLFGKCVLKSGEVLKEYIEPTKVIEKVKTIEEPKQVEKIIEKQEAKQIIQAKSIQISNNIKASIYEAAKACLEDKNITMFEKVLELLK